MVKVTVVRKQRVAGLLVVCCISLYIISTIPVSSVTRLARLSTRKLKHAFTTRINGTLDYYDDYDYDYAVSKFKYFYGPSRVPNIPEDLFPKPKYERKYFIYDCSKALCGGLGDRQEGIVAAYLIAQMMGRKFRVIMTVPCDINQVFEEAEERWIIGKEELVGLNIMPFKILDHAAWRLRETLGDMPLEQRFVGDVIMFNVNQEFVQYLMKLPRFQELKWAQNKTTPEIYNIVLRRLFKLKPQYQKRFDDFQAMVRAEGKKLVCAHIRLHDDRDAQIFHPKTVEYVDKFYRFLKLFNNTASYTMFVASNTDVVMTQVRQLFPKILVENEGPIIHIDEVKLSETDPASITGLPL